MLWDCDVVLAMLKRREAKMATGLASTGITELAKRLGEIISREIARKPHTAITSSRTWWRRTIFGPFPSSK
jgi:hypothetical protein